MIYIQHYNSYVGGITISSDGNALTGLWFDGQKYFAGNIDDEIEEKDVPVFVQARQWLDIYFSGHDPGFTPALTLDSTPFRRAVWEILLTIPFGKTMTYGEIAASIAGKKGCRRNRQEGKTARNGTLGLCRDYATSISGINCKSTLV